MRVNPRLNRTTVALATVWALACGGGGSGTDDGLKDVPDVTDAADAIPDVTPDVLDTPDVLLDAPEILDVPKEEISTAQCTSDTVDVDCAEICTDLDPCRKCTCNLALDGGTCEVVDAPADTTCEDGDVCTKGDKCAGGACVGGASICECSIDADCASLEDGNLCNGTLACDRLQFPYTCKVLESTIVKCGTTQDTDCMASQCAPATGTCAPQPVHTGEACVVKVNNFVDKCVVTAACLDGVCTSTLDRECSLGNPCETASCDPLNGCVRVPNTDPCDDGNPCTVDDACAGSIYRSGSPRVCDDGLFCNGTETCDRTQAQGCVVGTPPVCNDGSRCTDDQCSDVLRACVYTPRTDNFEGPRGAPNCSDGIDNDCDGLTDGVDPQCRFGLNTADPTDGPVTGGTVVTLSGPYLDQATQVFVDEVDTAFVLTSPATIAVTMPAHALGFVGFRVQAGTVSSSLPLAFRYVARSENPNVTAHLVGPLGEATILENVASPTYQAEITVPGVTDADPPATSAILGQFGYGLRNTNPWSDPSWRFVDVVGASTGTGSMLFSGSFTVSVGGYLDVAARFSLDGGATWVYADVDGTANGYSVAQALKLTVQGVPKAGAIVINELLWMGSYQEDFDEWIELRNTTRAPYVLSGWKVTNAKYLPGLPPGEIILDQVGQVVTNIVLEPYGTFLVSQFEMSKSQLAVVPDVAIQAASSSQKNLRLTNTPTLTYQLKGPDGTVVDEAKFTGKIGVHGDDTNGKPVQSMERNVVPGSGLLDTDWHTAFVATGWKGDPRQTKNLGTPGAPNSDIPLCASDADCEGVYPRSELGPCEYNSCVLPGGRCGIAQAVEGGACEDGLFCTVGEVCTAGSCGGGVARDCADAGPTARCTIDHCDETLDVCAHETDPATAEGPGGSESCSDGTDNDCDGLTDLADPGCNLSLIAVTPSQVPATGGWEMTLTGLGFGIVTGVSLGGIPADSFTLVDGGTITFPAPAQPDVGDRDVTVTDGTNVVNLAGAVRVIDLAPTVLANTQFPLDPLQVSLGMPTPTISGRVFADGFTNGPTPADPAAIVAEIGFGPVDDLQSDPYLDWGWSWEPAQHNPQCASCTDVYEFTATVQPPVTGTYLVAFRFSVDGGLRYQYGRKGIPAATPWVSSEALVVEVLPTNP